ncbi:hypothetical protein D3C78_1827300 [compost metagenome]
MLFDDADGVGDDRLRQPGLAGRNLLLGGHRAGKLPGVVEAADPPAEQAEGYQQEQQAAEPFADEQPDCLEHCAGSFPVGWR